MRRTKVVIEQTVEDDVREWGGFNKREAKDARGSR